MLKKAIIILLAELLAPVAASAQNNVQSYVNAELKTDPMLKNAAVALLVEDGSGRTVASWNPDQPLLSASTLKTITTGAALDALGAVASRPKEPSVQLPTYDGASVVYLSVDWPLPDNPDICALAGNGLRQRRADLSGIRVHNGG